MFLTNTSRKVSGRQHLCQWSSNNVNLNSIQPKKLWFKEIFNILDCFKSKRPLAWNDSCWIMSIVDWIDKWVFLNNHGIWLNANWCVLTEYGKKTDWIFFLCLKVLIFFNKGGQGQQRGQNMPVNKEVYSRGTSCPASVVYSRQWEQFLALLCGWPQTIGWSWSGNQEQFGSKRARPISRSV